MSQEELRKGDQRYLHGDLNRPITITTVYDGAFEYVEGFHSITITRLVDFVPIKPVKR